MARMQFKRPNFGLMITSAISLAVIMFAGEKIMVSIAGMLNQSGTMFVDAFDFLGFGNNGVILDGTVNNDGILTIMAIIAVIGILMSFVKISL